MELVSRMKKDLYNGDDDPERGFIPEIRAFLVEERAERRRRWKRSDKIAALGILLVLLAWPSKKMLDFFSDVESIVQEWHEVHKGEVITPKHSLFEQKPVAAAGTQPETAADPFTPTR